jgi:pheromone shutdown protein TraB
MAAAATERCRVWPKDVKCVRAHCRGAGSSHHPAIFPVQVCRSSVKIALHELTEIPQSSAIFRTVSLLLLRMIVLTLAIIVCFNFSNHFLVSQC